MTGKPQQVHFTVTEQFINVHVMGASVCQFGVTPDGRIVLAFPSSAVYDQMELFEGSIVRAQLQPLQVTMVFQEMDDDLAIPRYRRQHIAPEAPPQRRRVRVTEGGQSIASGEVTELVEAICQSYVEEPNQTKMRTAAITKELSQRFGIPVMSIAGVRANLTRGTYGDFNTMVAAAGKRRST